MSLNVLRPTFFNICNFPFYAIQVLVKLGSKLGKNLTTFPTLRAPAPTKFQFSVIFFTDI